jgi:hypothetical protein
LEGYSVYGHVKAATLKLAHVNTLLINELAIPIVKNGVERYSRFVLSFEELLGAAFFSIAVALVSDPGVETNHDRDHDLDRRQSSA